MRQRGVSRAHVNYPNICIWVSLQKKTKKKKASPPLLQPNSNFILRIIVNSGGSVNSVNTPHQSSLSHTRSHIPCPSFVCLEWLVSREGRREAIRFQNLQFSLLPLLLLLLLTYRREMTFFPFFWADGEEGKGAMLDVTGNSCVAASMHVVCVCQYIKHNTTVRKGHSLY